MNKFAILLLLTGIAATFTNAQFPIKMPKITVPKAEQPKTATPDATKSTTATAQRQNAASVSGRGPGKLVLNDAATQFTLEAVTVNHKDVGWNLDFDLHTVGDVPSRTAARLVIKKNGKELYTNRCEFRNSTYDKNRASSCLDRKKVISEIGVMNVEIYLINGDTDEETLARTYKIDVHKATKFDDGRPDYYIQRHADAAVAYLTVNDGVLYLGTFFSPVDDANNKFGAKPFLRCSVNGQSLEMPYTHINFRHGPVSRATLTGRRKDRSVYREIIQFDRTGFQLPLSLNGTWGNSYDVAKKPGRWECRIVSDVDRSVFRTIRFEVMGNGSITPHPEQRNGNVNLGPNQTMIEIEIPPGGSSIDERLMPQPEMGFLLGIPWTTPEGKAAAAKVPKKGDPYPVPQN